jgi:hypothetical protein
VVANFVPELDSRGSRAVQFARRLHIELLSTVSEPATVVLRALEQPPEYHDKQAAEQTDQCTQDYVGHAEMVRAIRERASVISPG